MSKWYVYVECLDAHLTFHVCDHKDCTEYGWTCVDVKPGTHWARPNGWARLGAGPESRDFCNAHRPQSTRTRNIAMTSRLPSMGGNYVRG